MTTTDLAGPATPGPGLIRVVPNLLTSARIVIGLMFPFLEAESRWIALLIGLATEFLDGQAARLLRVPSTMGQMLDPIADKVFVLAVLVTLLLDRTLAPWQLMLVIARDVLVTAGVTWVAATRGVADLTRMRPSLVGKSATAAQFLFLLATVAYQSVNPVLLGVTSGLSLAAGVGYLIRYR